VGVRASSDISGLPFRGSAFFTLDFAIHNLDKPDRELFRPQARDRVTLRQKGAEGIDFRVE
jgi:hypothetical protein